jgi:hypothetical protein
MRYPADLGGLCPFTLSCCCGTWTWTTDLCLLYCMVDGRYWILVGERMAIWHNIAYTSDSFVSHMFSFLRFYLMFLKKVSPTVTAITASTGKYERGFQANQKINNFALASVSYTFTPCPYASCESLINPPISSIGYLFDRLVSFQYFRRPPRMKQNHRRLWHKKSLPSTHGQQM